MKRLFTAAVLAATLVIAAPVSAQPNDPMGTPIGEVTEDGYLRVDYDVFVDCRSDFSEPAGSGNPAVQAEIERQVEEQTRACREAGFPPPDGPDPSGQYTDNHPDGTLAPRPDAPQPPSEPGELPDTGGATLLPLLAGLVPTVFGLLLLR